MDFPKEHGSYHALAVALSGEYHALRRAFRSFGSWEAAWEAAQREHLVAPPREEAWAALGRSEVRLVLAADPEFPPLLKEIPAPPFGLYVRGTLPRPEERWLAIVGTRRASAVGLRAARELAGASVRAGLGVASGLAFGVDAAAHEGALEGGGRTLAVLASGVDRVSPRSHERLGKRILDHGGALVSEYPPGSDALARRFIERNRIVSGMTSGVLIIEAPHGSGALTTARFALDQNREVLVVPGSVHHPNYCGSHELIREGATLVTGIEEILEALGIAPSSSAASGGAAVGGAVSDPAGTLIVEALRKEGRPLDADTLASLTRLELPALQSRLSILVLEGRIEERGGRYAPV